MKRFDGLTALITGGTTGIGLATAQRFLAACAKVAIMGTNPDALSAAQLELG
jgi:NAD(P)-dependent dehydrogenase (short-subunit alcohol dehydrogenase family)